MKRTLTKTLVLSCLLVIGLLLLGVATASATSGAQRNPNFLLPGEMPGGSTGTTTYTNPGQNPQFVVPGQSSAGSSSTGTRNPSFLLPGESSGAPIGGTGFRNGSFLQPGETPKDQSGNPLSSVVRGATSGRVVNCKEWVNVRSGPSTGNKVTGRANLGDSLRIIEWDKTGNWVNAYYNEKGPGWINTKFVGY